MTREEAVKKAIENFEWAIHADNRSDISLTDMRMAISALMEQPCWISVEERLPDHPNKVLIYNKSGKYGVGKYIERMDCFITTGQTVVTHWMELPDPPEEA